MITLLFVSLFFIKIVYSMESRYCGFTFLAGYQFLWILWVAQSMNLKPQ